MKQKLVKLIDKILLRPGQWLLSFQYCSECHHLSLTQIMRQLRREADLLTLLK